MGKEDTKKRRKRVNNSLAEAVSFSSFSLILAGFDRSEELVRGYLVRVERRWREIEGKKSF